MKNINENNNEWEVISDWEDRAEPTEDQEPTTKRRKVKCTVHTDTYLYRRAFSEVQLLDVAGLNFKEGESYHFITGGDVDALSYLKLILRQQSLDFCLFSTWCMAAEDILTVQDWLEGGKIKKLDAYFGEIFPNSYIIEYQMIVEMFEKYKCGRYAIFRNHSKIFAGIGPKFAFGIQTSANINTNPRTENGCITIGKGIYDFYKDYFDGIVSFERDKKSPKKHR